MLCISIDLALKKKKNPAKILSKNNSLQTDRQISIARDL
jgi:hypothetical protein